MSENGVSAGPLDLLVKPGTRWLHTNGNIYTVLHLANEHADEARRDEYPLRVVYHGPDGKVWDNEPEAFLRSRTLVTGGCDHCNHPLFSGRLCKNCGKLHWLDG